MKRIILTLIIFISSLSLFAVPCMYYQGNISVAYTTNVFSHPLPVNASDDWLQNKIDNPFLKRFDCGGDASLALYFAEEDRVGLSSKLKIGAPVKVTRIKPSSADSSSDWSYISEETDNQLPSVIASFGPEFRCRLDNWDIGLSLRLSLGSLNLADGSLVVGLQTEYFANYFFNPHTYLSAGLTSDAHLMRFINDRNKYYEEGFFMTSITPFIGIGVKIGTAEK